MIISLQQTTTDSNSTKYLVTFSSNGGLFGIDVTDMTQAEQIFDLTPENDRIPVAFGDLGTTFNLPDDILYSLAEKNEIISLFD